MSSKSMLRTSLTLTALAAIAAAPAALGQHPHPMPRPGPSLQVPSSDGSTTFVFTPEGGFMSGNPIVSPPGTNFLMTVDSNMFDAFGNEMPNTLPSTAANPYNLHDGPVITTEIPLDSPTSDLRAIINAMKGEVDDMPDEGGMVDQSDLQRAIDILEGNEIPDRLYSGLPLLHYKGPEKVKVVQPIFDGDGNKIGGNVDVHQIWYDSHIESDTAFIDPSEVLDVTWTITYTVDVLDRGHDDFSPFVMYFDDPAASPPGMPPMPHVAMDQTFFPMDEGTRNVFKIKMSLGKYYNLTYTWGWRVHPPRVQVSENARKVMAGLTLPEWEESVFGPNPSATEEDKLAAIAMIGDMAPAKRMWNAFRGLATVEPMPRDDVDALVTGAEAAFLDWYDRQRLPRGVPVDKKTDMTLFYVNNTIYGEFGDQRQIFRHFDWQTRPNRFTVTLRNGDYFPHGYMNVDFGGSRGWENQFHSTVPLLGSGCWFSFGRVHWWVNAGGPWGGIIVPPAKGSVLGEHRVWMRMNFEPSRRLRLYQFDPLHHDVAVFSIH